MEKLKADLNMGNNLRRLRKANGLTQDQLVARLGILGDVYKRQAPPTGPLFSLFVFASACTSTFLLHLDHHMVPMAVLQHMAESTMPLAERPGRPARDGNTMGSFGPLFLSLIHI